MATSAPHQRPRTPSRSQNGPSPPNDATAAAGPPPLPAAAPTPRRSSFNFLRRGKSVERMNNGKRSASGGKLSKNGRHGDQSPTDAQPVPQRPPTIPNVVPPPKLATFGGENAPAGKPHAFVEGPPRPSLGDDARRNFSLASRDGNARPYNVPMPDVPGAVDPYARTESMTHRGRYSYASSAVSSYTGPRRVRRRKDPTPFKYVCPSLTFPLLAGCSSSLRR